MDFGVVKFPNQLCHIPKQLDVWKFCTKEVLHETNPQNADFPELHQALLERQIEVVKCDINLTFWPWTCSAWLTNNLAGGGGWMQWGRIPYPVQNMVVDHYLFVNSKVPGYSCPKFGCLLQEYMTWP